MLMVVVQCLLWHAHISIDVHVVGKCKVDYIAMSRWPMYIDV